MYRDLWLSPDHAVFDGENLIPIRHLINDCTIRQFPCERVDYYHVELARHDVLLAEGLPAESYLDTGNRSAFENGGAARALHPSFGGAPQRYRELGSYAPLVVDESQIRTVWQRLADRAVALDYQLVAADVTADADIRLAIGEQIVAPVWADEQKCVFALPTPACDVRVISRRDRPTSLRPWLNDRRRLGIAVTRIILQGRQGRSEIAIDSPALVQGWHCVERDAVRAWRWTDGDAALCLPRNTMVLELRLAGALPYRLSPEGCLAAA